MGIWYRTGTVTVVTGDPNIVGVGTLMLTQAAVGDIWIGPDLAEYEITSITDDTHWAVKQKNNTAGYAGSSASAQPHAVIRNFTSTLPAQLASQLAAMMTAWHSTTDDMANWLGGTGTVTIHDAAGVAHSVKTPAALEGAVSGRLSKSVAGGADVTLSTTEASNLILDFTGVLTGNINVIVPASTRIFNVFNNTTGAFTLTVKTPSGTGVAIKQGNRQVIECDATNVVAAVTGVSGAFDVVGALTAGSITSGPISLTGSDSFIKEYVAWKWTSTGLTGGTFRGQIFADNTGILNLQSGGGAGITISASATPVVAVGGSLTSGAITGSGLIKATSSSFNTQLAAMRQTALANGNLAATVRIGGGNTGGATADIDYAQLVSIATTATAGAEDGNLSVTLMRAGANVEVMNLAGVTGLMTLPYGQIKFPATQNASSDANTLDDYEEGTFTPSVGGSATYNAGNGGRYTKVGRSVVLEGTLSINAIGTGSTNLITGFPFTVAGYQPTMSVNYFSSIAIAEAQISIYLNTGGVTGNYSGLAAAGTSSGVSLALNQNATAVYFSGNYSI